jgi:hypothetical protein
MCWADSRHICIKFCTLREALRVSKKRSGDSNRILRKQKSRGLVARIIHYMIDEMVSGGPYFKYHYLIRK